MSHAIATLSGLNMHTETLKFNEWWFMTGEICERYLAHLSLEAQHEHDIFDSMADPSIVLHCESARFIEGHQVGLTTVCEIVAVHAYMRSHCWQLWCAPSLQYSAVTSDRPLQGPCRPQLLGRCSEAAREACQGTVVGQDVPNQAVACS